MMMTVKYYLAKCQECDDTDWFTDNTYSMVYAAVNSEGILTNCFHGCLGTTRFEEAGTYKVIRTVNEEEFARIRGEEAVKALKERKEAVRRFREIYIKRFPEAAK